MAHGKREQAGERFLMPKSNKTLAERFWFYVNKDQGLNEGCWMWTGAKNGDGYGLLKYNGRATLAHRAACLILGIDIRGKCVCHSCDNRLCINPDHFFVGTVGDNNRDRHAKGRSRGGSNAGERHPLARLTARQIIEIFTSTLPPRVIAKTFGTTPCYVCEIRRGGTWKSVTSGLVRGYHAPWQTMSANNRRGL